MTGIDDAPTGPDWIINLNQPVRQPMTDPRIDEVQAALRDMQPQYIAIAEVTKQLEAVLRDCAETGMTRDEIAIQASVSIEAVTRVLNGGSLLGWDAR